MTTTKPDTECHPWQPFLPDGAKILMLGSFPPKPLRWSMDFFYPNFNNDMWRIMGLIFYGDKEHFVARDSKHFDRAIVEAFCHERGIALYDTAVEVRRLKDNASDAFLEIVTPTDLDALLARIPECRAIVATGEKAAATIAATCLCEVPKVGNSTVAKGDGRQIRFYRMPSSSRAYPLSVERKAELYRAMFAAEGFL